MVDRIDKERYELAHINICKPRSCKEFRSSVDQVGSKYLGDDAFLICSVEMLDAFGEKTESYGTVDVSGAALLHLAGDIEHGIT